MLEQGPGELLATHATHVTSDRDVRVIAAIFGVPERAEALIAHWRGRLDRVADRLPDDAEPVPVFCWDWGTDSLGTGAGLTIVPELYR